MSLRLLLSFMVLLGSTLSTNHIDKNFPALKNDNLLRAARGEPVDRVPVWVMRQAGRYLPEFKEIRKVYDFFTICRTPELACEVTMQPLIRFDLDASIIFSDILVIPQAYGMDIEMKPGPFFNDPLNTPEDIEKLKPEGAIQRLDYVGQAITMMRHKLNGRIPLIGFTGAPWTLMGYMTGGSGKNKDISKTKEWFTKYPEGTKKLLEMLTQSVIEYLVMQIKAGAQIVQVFESSAGLLSKEEFLTIAVPYLKEINDKVKQTLIDQGIPTVPMILFAKGAGDTLREQSVLGYDVIGIDFHVDPVEARKQVGPNVTLQGNLDPQDMYKSPEELTKLVTEMVQKFGKHRYIANLGDGITPETPIESMDILVNTVHKAV